MPLPTILRKMGGLVGGDGMDINDQTARSSPQLPKRQVPTVELSTWQRWLQHPERFWVRKMLFQIHLSVGAGVGLYLVSMSVTGSVFRRVAREPS
ncbi:MAG: hypothetical protein ABI604_15595 [Nitrospirota bacterium]